MKLEFIIDNSRFNSGFSVYKKLDCSLEYKIIGGKKDTYCEFLLSCGTLTFAFDPITRDFISLDDYTNVDLWNKKNIVLPKICSSGTLIIKSGFEDDDRYSYDLKPYYEYSENIINIILSKKFVQNSVFYAIADDFIVSINNNILTSCYILDTKFV